MSRKYRRLRYADRKVIEDMCRQGNSVKEIADVLGTCRDTIYREFNRCELDRKTYTAVAGQRAI